LSKNETNIERRFADLLVDLDQPPVVVCCPQALIAELLVGYHACRRPARLSP